MYLGHLEMHFQVSAFSSYKFYDTKDGQDSEPKWGFQKHLEAQILLNVCGVWSPEFLQQLLLEIQHKLYKSRRFF